MHAARILNKNATYYPDAPAVVDGERRLTFKELDQRVRRLISVFRSLGVEKGERIAILAYNCQEYLECMHACERGGFVCVPLNWRLDPDNIAFILNHSESKVLTIHGSLLNLILPVKEQLPRVQHVLAFGSQEIQTLPEWIEPYESSLEAVKPDHSAPEISEKDLAYIIYSSGTTGLPKGVMFNQRMQLEAAKTFISELGLKQSDITLNVMPLFHSGGHTMASAISYVAGTNIMMEKFDAAKVLQTISTEKVSVIHLVPTMLASLLEVPHIEEYDLRSLRTIFYAASPISLSLLRKAMTVFGHDRFIQMYGLTENGPSVSCLSREDHIKGSEENAGSLERKRLESVGIPHFNVEVRIVGQEGENLVLGTVGEIAVRSESTTTGYWKQPELSSRKIKDGWLLTGDMGLLDPAGYLYIVDRKDDMIISGGENVYPNEVESVLAGHLAVKEAVVVGVPDEKWGEAVVAVVALWQGMQVDGEELFKYCRERIAGYKMPKRIVIRDTLPKTASGKILRRLVKEQLNQ